MKTGKLTFALLVVLLCSVSVFGAPEGILAPPTGEIEGAVTVEQSNGFDNCLYYFYDVAGEDSPVIATRAWVRNLRLKRWADLELPDNFVPVTGSVASPVGINHILFSGGASGDRLYHTVTGTMVSKEESDASKSRGFAPADIVVIVLYFAALAWIGFYFSRRQKNSDDYFKGGGRIPWWAAGLSLFGTALSAITFMAIPAKAFATDWSYMLFNSGIVLVAPVIMFLFIPFFRKLNITTAYQYLEVRFNSFVRVICSLAFIVFQLGRMGVVLFLPAIALNVATGMDIFLCIALMGVSSIIYTMIGGIEAVVWTDALQVVILLGGAIFAIIFTVNAIPGGFSETVSVAAAHGKFSLGDTGFDLKDSSMWTVLIAACFTHLTTYGTDQSMVQRYLTTSSGAAAKKSVLTNALLTIPATLIFFFVGTALFVFYKSFPAELSLSLPNNDAIFPSYIFSNMPAGLSGLLISGVFAAAMSTLSGSMNSAATAWVVDIRPRIVRHSGDKRRELRSARVTTLVMGGLSLCFAFLMATWEITSLWDEFNKILGLILGSMGGLFLLGMITRRANAPGAIVGICVSIVVQLFVAHFQVVHLLLYTATGFVSCFVAGYVASLFFRTPSRASSSSALSGGNMN